MKRRVRIALLVAVVLLFVASIPWYREPGAVPIEFLGLPDWVAVALLCYVAAAVLNSLAWLITDIPDQSSAPGEDEP